MLSIARSCAFLAVAVASALAEEIGLKPFLIDHRAAGPTAVDVSFLVRNPGGADGPIRIRDGHLVRADGSRFRFFGVNLTSVAPSSVHFPEKDDADFWAERLARLGVNCVRLHMVDAEAPKGIIAPNRDDTRHFDAAALDRFDYLVAALKRHGIYVDLNLNVSRRYKAGDGVRDYALIGSAKALTFFDTRLIELQKEYARALLTHYNPYTKSEYRSEPAVAIIELVNENSIIGAWVRGRLTGAKTSGPAQEWQDIPPAYAAELTERYNQWLAANLAPAQRAELRRAAGVGEQQPVPRLHPAEFATAPRIRFATEAAFYTDIERTFYREMRDFLRKTIGTDALLLGTSDHSFGRSYYPTLSANAELDIIDAHGPWERAPMVDEPANSIPVRTSRTAMAGKPFIVSEHNHRFPSDYTSEGIPLLAAYGAFQDWDGIFLYTFEMKHPGYAGRIETRADLSYDPVKLVNLVAGALMFRRGDVAAAKETVVRSYTREQTVDSLHLTNSTAGVYLTPGFSSLVALWHGSRVGSLDGAPTRVLAVPDASPIVSDTGQLSWYFTPGGAVTGEEDQKFVTAAAGSRAPHNGAVVVDTPRTQALIGFLHARPSAASQLGAAIRNDFACLVLSSLDGEPISVSRRMLLAATSRDINTGVTWNAAHTALTNWGTSPTLIEPVTGSISLRGLAPATAVRVAPLDGAGNPQSPVAAQATASGDWQFSIGDTATTWYLVSVERK